MDNRKIVDVRGYEKRNGETHLHVIYEDGTYKELDVAQVVEILNDWTANNRQLKISDIAPPAKRKAG
jgi:hypothetical protein